MQIKNAENYTQLMRLVRIFRSDCVQERMKEKKAIDSIDRKMYSNFYVENLAKEVHEQTNAEIEKHRKTAFGKVNALLNELRENAEFKTGAAPTTEMLNILTANKMLDEYGKRPTATQVQMYANIMASCPQAMQVLHAQADRWHYTIKYIDADKYMRAIDVLEFNIQEYLSKYSGQDLASAPTSFRLLDRFFHLEDSYAADPEWKSSDYADMRFWDEYVGYGSPEMLEKTKGGVSTPAVHYYFTDGEKLLTHISESTKGLAEEQAKAVREEIFARSPELYRKFYEAAEKGENLPAWENE